MICVNFDGGMEKDGSEFLGGFHNREEFLFDGGVVILGGVKFLEQKATGTLFCLIIALS